MTGFRAVRSTPADTPVTDAASARKMVHWLAHKGCDYPTVDRHRAAYAVIDWITSQEEYVQRVESGCQALLLQAAERVGAADPILTPQPAASGRP